MPAIRTPRRAAPGMDLPMSTPHSFQRSQESDNLSVMLASAIRVHERVRTKSLQLETENKRLHEEISHMKQSLRLLDVPPRPDSLPTARTPILGCTVKTDINDASGSGSQDDLRQMCSSSSECFRPRMPTKIIEQEELKNGTNSSKEEPAVRQRNEPQEQERGNEYELMGTRTEYELFEFQSSPMQGESMPGSSSSSKTELNHWQQELVDIFQELDRDGSGTLSTEELRSALELAGVPRARLAKLLRLADFNSSGEIDLTGWINSITKSCTSDMVSLSSSLSRHRSERGPLYRKKDPCDLYMINPRSCTRMSWDAWMSTLCLYISLALPFTIAWERQMSSQRVDGLRAVDRCINYLFIVDIFLNFRTGFFNRESDLVMVGKQAAQHYLRTWFPLDFLSCFPFEEFEDEASYFANAGGVSPTRAIKILKLFKLLRVLRLMRPRNFNPEDFSVVLEDLAQSKIIQIMHRRSTLFTYTLLLCHWLACGMKIVDEGFLTSYDGAEVNLWSQYLSAIYWAMTTLTTVGYGDITPSSDGERAFVSVSMVVGAGFYGYVVGAITSLVQNSDVNASAYYDRMDLVQAWLNHHRLPMEVKRTIRRYFKNYLVDKSAINEADIWRELSPELKREVGGFFIHEDVKNNPLFDGMSMGSVVRLQAILQRITIEHGHTITKNGEVGTAMYIIVSGSVSLSRGPREEKLGPGQSFGEEVLLGFVENYEYTVTVLQKAKLELILESEFVDLFRTMPNELERMRQNALEFNPHWASEKNRD